jgi:hypothetical protein
MEIKRKRGRPRKKNNIKLNDNKIKILKIEKHLNKKKEYKNNLLVHLPISLDLIEKYNKQSFENEYLNYDNIVKNIVNEPKPFEEESNIIQEKLNNNIKKDVKVESKEKIKLKEEVINKKIIKLMEYDRKMNITNDILCWWCCHSFNNQIFGIPIKKEKEIYKVYGCFCNLKCAKSYNDNEDISLLLKQQRDTLIDILNHDIRKEYDSGIKFEIVKKAPPREVLKIFGGYMEIEEFRNEKKELKLIYPPIITIIPDVEELEIEEKKEIKFDKNIIKKDIKTNIMKIFK